MNDVQDRMITLLAAQIQALTERVTDLESQMEDAVVDTNKLVPEMGPWPGYARVARFRYYDADFTDDTSGTAIVDNLTTGNAKRYIKVKLLPSVVVSWEDGPIPLEFPPAEEWYDITKDHDIHIPWIG